MDKLFSDDEVASVPMQIVDGCLVLSVQVELYDATLQKMRSDLLHRIRDTGVRKCIIDLAAVELMDPVAYRSVCDTAEMAKVMGAHTVLSGVGPGVASALVQLGVNPRPVETSLNLEDGYKRLARKFEVDPSLDEAQQEDEAEAAQDGAGVERTDDQGGISDETIATVDLP